MEVLWEDGALVGRRLEFDDDQRLLRSCPVGYEMQDCLVVAEVRADGGDGTVRAFAEDGALVAEYHVDGGVLDGPIALFAADGTPVLDGAYRRGRRHGRWRERSVTNSAEILRATYDDGVLDGPWYRAWWQHVEVGTYRDDQRSGTWNTRYGDGMLVIATYASGVRHGPSETRQEDDALVAAGNYVQGVRYGTWTLRRDDALVQATYRDGDIAELEPHLPRYAWMPVQLDAAVGGVFGGGERTLRFRGDLAWVAGSAFARDGAHAGGGFVGVGVQLALDTVWRDGVRAPDRATLGPTLAIGWAWDDYAPASPTPDTHVHLRATPFRAVAGADGWGLRLGAGLTSPRWSRAVFAALSEPIESSSDDPAPLIEVLARVAGWCLFPILTANSLEITAELGGAGYRPERYGVMLGWGF